MSNSHIENISVLKKFVFDNNIQNDQGIIHFNCEFNIKTPKGIEIENCDARITFNGFNNEGELTVNSDLPPLNYPTVFRAKYNEFSIENDILTIRDIHPTIGKYEAKIIL